MKYIGEKSLSSFLSRLLRILWWAALAAAIFYVLVLTINLFSINQGDPITSTLSKWDMRQTDTDLFLFFRWEQLTSWPVAGKVAALVFWVACIVINLMILEKARQLFSNFKKDIVFSAQNINLLSLISKLLITASVITWSLYTLVVSIMLLILCQVFKRGAELQEDHDLTV